MPSSERTSSPRQAPGKRAGAGQGRPLADAATLARPRPPRSTAEQLGPYLYRIPMSSGVWAISTDEGPDAVQPRGLYQQERDQDQDGNATVRHVFRAALPYVHARIIRRDGSGDRLDTDYLISAAQDGPRVIVTSARVRRGDWAGAVGLSLSDDPKIIQAAGTAIRHMAPLDRDYGGEREAIPRCEADGRVIIPAPETLPAGYLRTGPLGRAEALARWREIIAPVATGNPQFALVLGASAVSPFAGWLDYSDVRAFIVDLAGEPNGGKSTTARTAGAIWGEVPKNGNGVVGPWNLSAQGPGRALGMLGILPAIFDEQGVSGYSPDQWARIILSITDGSRRAADRDGGLRVTHPYSGVVISAGNASIAAGLGAGRYAGIGPKRVNTLTGPFTGSAEQAESVKPVLRDAHGHVGQVILERFTGGDVAALIKDAARLIRLPSGITARSAGKNMHLLIAGASILDRVLSTGTAIRDAAARGARDYLETNSQEPEHDADRMLTLIRDSLAAEPSRWPTVAEYREHKLPPAVYGEHGPADPGRVELPRHGVDRHVMGVRADAGDWFAVFGTALDDVLTRAGADRSVALTEADRRGWLHRTDTDRKAGKLATFVKHVGRAHRFNLPAEPEDQDQAVTLAPEPGPAPDGCLLCGEPTSHRIDGEPWHPWHYEPEAEEAGAEEPAAELAEPAAEEPAPSEAVISLPFAAAVRAYLTDCAGAGLDPRYHPTPDGAVKTIAHHGKAEADLIRAAYAAATGTTSAEAERGELAEPMATEPAGAEQEPAPQAPAEGTAGDGQAQAPEPAQARSEPRADATEAEELAAFTRAMRKVDADATDADLSAALNIFHEVTGGVRWVSYAGQVGQAWFSMLAARHASMRRPEALTGATVQSIADSGPLTRVNFVARPRTAPRPGKHFVASFDINGQHAAAAGSADLGDGDPVTVAKPRSIAGLVNLPGYVKLGAALKTGHPAFGTLPAGQWVAMPLVKFLASDLGLTVPAAEAVYWPKHGRRLSAYIGQYRTARERLTSAAQTGPARLALAALKSQANAFVGMFHSETYSHGGFYRPDWYDQIVATAEANALRHFYGPRAKCKVAPVAKMADAVYFVAATDAFTPDGLEVSGQLGKWKPDRRGPVTDDLVKAIKDGQPASVRDAVITIDAERRAAR